MSYLLVIVGLALLVMGGEFLVRSSVALSFKFNISKMVIGMTVVAFATSAPELLVSLQAAFSGSSAIALNNVIGSNIANIGLIMGVTALVSPIAVDLLFHNFNWPMVMLFSIALYYALYNDNVLTFYEGLFLFIGLIVFIVVLIRNSKKQEAVNITEDVDESLSVVSNFKIVVWLMIGAVALYFGSEWLVTGSKQLALAFGVSEAVIGVSLIAVGTSIPELAASLIAVIKKEKALSLGNLIGSNIFNIGAVLGITAMITPIPVTEPLILSRDVFWMLGFAFMLLPLILIPKKFEINKLKGLLLVAIYGGFMYLVFV